MLPWWEAPYPYDPVSFLDRVGGEDGIVERRVLVLSGGRESLRGEGGGHLGRWGGEGRGGVTHDIACHGR